MRTLLFAAVAAVTTLGGMAFGGAGAADAPRLIGPTPFLENPAAPQIAPDVADDVRRTRNYPEQPPVIPHSIRDYQIDLRHNRCLDCHSRKYTEQSQAPMISITHYQDREGNMLGGLAPRRYACTACHVPQTAAQPLVENRFRDLDSIVSPPGGGR
ncbi:nitrate reductase cytochrome c-type subunit [Azospirillum sp.]|uniref:nitrate reductase cytochrome c-type subunit n=1 Tax=Azospirillum sp. TaxID=34012 RepID=UPI002D603514|nr:nitrate reductase cytochrome c-type subunit [Azospirillum sp.]HYD68886.1 nitrate reductase cytochrome c-type subunit [Azospirillum sp.]